MKKIGILTFHASHNFGSMLQAFALQKTLKKMGYLCQIINFRSKDQIENCSGVYQKPVRDLKGILRKLLLFPFRKELTEKHNRFERFLNDCLLCTPIYKTEQEVLKNCSDFDVYICGSDQIWNMKAKDFNWIYFLPFKNGKKIAYAPSAGDNTYLSNKDKIKELLSRFSAICVREEKLSVVLSDLLPQKPTVLVDPTLLLLPEEWEKYISKEPIVKGDYLFLYSPYHMSDLVHIIPKDNKLPVVICSPLDLTCLYSPKYVKCLSSGPWEFLNLIYHSKGVVSGSFHAAVFAKLFKKPLYCIDMGKESRINNLEIKFKNIEHEREAGLKFLQDALK